MIHRVNNKKETAEERQNRNENFIEEMKREYGIKETVRLPAIKRRYPNGGLPERVIPAGEFWYFQIEGFGDEDADIDGLAKIERKKKENRELFHAYLAGKYWDWLIGSENEEDDCMYLIKKRRQARENYESQFYDNAVKEEQQQKIMDKEFAKAKQKKEKMASKLRKGEITQDKYDEWHLKMLEKEHEDAYDFLSR